MNLICYCVGGIGNRLRALSSCHSLATITNRNLVVIWEPALRCMSRFNELYTNDFNVADKRILVDLKNYTLYGLEDAIFNEVHLNNNPELAWMCEAQGLINTRDESNQLKILSDTSDNVVVCTNNFIAGSDQSKEKQFLTETLNPIQEIVDKLHQEQQQLQLDKSIIGVHARGTDFNTPTSFYTDQMARIEAGKFFVCSDSAEVENEIRDMFGDRVLLRTSKEYVCKENPDASWDNNVRTPLDSIKDALVDMYLLAKTNFLVYNSGSTFTDIVRKMQ